MIYISVEDFLAKTEAAATITREEEKKIVAQMMAGDASARDKLVEGYLPFAASFIRRAPGDIQTLTTVYDCIACVGKSVDRFDFSRNRERFVEYLGRALRQCIVRCLAERS